MRIKQRGGLGKWWSSMLGRSWLLEGCLNWQIGLRKKPDMWMCPWGVLPKLFLRGSLGFSVGNTLLLVSWKRAGEAQETSRLEGRQESERTGDEAAWGSNQRQVVYLREENVQKENESWQRLWPKEKVRDLESDSLVKPRTSCIVSLRSGLLGEKWGILAVFSTILRTKFTVCKAALCETKVQQMAAGYHNCWPTEHICEGRTDLA